MRFAVHEGRGPAKRVGFLSILISKHTGTWFQTQQVLLLCVLWAWMAGCRVLASISSPLSSDILRTCPHLHPQYCFVLRVGQWRGLAPGQEVAGESCRQRWMPFLLPEPSIFSLQSCIFHPAILHRVTSRGTFQRPHPLIRTHLAPQKRAVCSPPLSWMFFRIVTPHVHSTYLHLLFSVSPSITA